jgi:hypothetical protein
MFDYAQLPASIDHDGFVKSYNCANSTTNVLGNIHPLIDSIYFRVIRYLCLASQALRWKISAYGSDTSVPKGIE